MVSRIQLSCSKFSNSSWALASARDSTACNSVLLLQRLHAHVKAAAFVKDCNKNSATLSTWTAVSVSGCVVCVRDVM